MPLGVDKLNFVVMVFFWYTYAESICKLVESQERQGPCEQSHTNSQGRMGGCTLSYKPSHHNLVEDEVKLNARKMKRRDTPRVSARQKTGLNKCRCVRTDKRWANKLTARRGINTSIQLTLLYFRSERLRFVSFAVMSCKSDSVDSK
jgi:hypothetical protein